MQLALFEETSLKELLKKREDQWFDRKSVRIEPRDLANTMIGFANADGGRIVIGISSGKIEGITSRPEHINEFLQAGLNHTEPPVHFTPSQLECANEAGQPDQVLILDIVASENIHHNKRGECFLRVGDENRHLQPDSHFWRQDCWKVCLPISKKIK